MKKYLNIKFILIHFAITIPLSFVFFYFSGMNFFACFAIVEFSMIVNGFIAEYEDGRRGGFYNPENKKGTLNKNKLLSPDKGNLDEENPIIINIILAIALIVLAFSIIKYVFYKL